MLKKDNLEVFFLGGRKISFWRVAHLLTSSSFGINAIFYAAWLGYLMGIWGMILQIVWCLSFLLFSRFSDKIYQSTSMHDFFGSKFGKLTRKIAALCSIIGLLYFAGWEIGIAKSILESMLILTKFTSSILIVLFIFVPIIYTTIGGQKINSLVDEWLNLIKFGLLVFIIGLLIIHSQNTFSLNLIFPPINFAIAAIGWFGLITNLIFNLSWQFVDNTSWQSVSSNKNHPKKSLFFASGGVFLAYLFSTLLGAILRGIPNLTSNNIFGGITLGLSGNYQIVVSLVIIVLVLLSMVSLIDGISLSVSQSISIDLGLINYFSKKPKLKLLLPKILTIFAGIFAAWGVSFIVGLIGGGIFDFVYILIVFQLGLLGPVVIGLISKNSFKNKLMWVSILLSIVIGLTSSIVGATKGISYLVDGAGSITALSSIILSLLFNFIKKRCLKK